MATLNIVLLLMVAEVLVLLHQAECLHLQGTQPYVAQSANGIQRRIYHSPTSVKNHDPPPPPDMERLLRLVNRANDRLTNEQKWRNLRANSELERILMSDEDDDLSNGDENGKGNTNANENAPGLWIGNGPSFGKEVANTKVGKIKEKVDKLKEGKDKDGDDDEKDEENEEEDDFDENDNGDDTDENDAGNEESGEEDGNSDEKDETNEGDEGDEKDETNEGEENEENMDDGNDENTVSGNTDDKKRRLLSLLMRELRNLEPTESEKKRCGGTCLQ